MTKLALHLTFLLKNLSWENKLAMNEWDNLHNKFEKLGERETITSPKEDIKLKGFDESFPEALRLGREKGLLEGSAWVRKQARFKDKYNIQGNAEQ
ncbi:hypothetical protein DSO57_1013845 [Entomophthora muscae]|uniref:Uncharacterized protein n=1 Tax=Entomophthora muscae TaxID=34485 RepID=A0ACC2T5S5_9FUNG|nr:hypothetical protein DSO57_1013845 [Entomophthora muscae]